MLQVSLIPNTKAYVSILHASQVHDIHPSHAFLLVREKPSRSQSDRLYLSLMSPHDLVEQRKQNNLYLGLPANNAYALKAMKHPGVKCAQ